MKNQENLKRDNTTGKNHTGNHANKPLKRLTATSIIGDKVSNPAGEPLGKIMDMMIDIEDGKIEYVVLEFGGFMGMNQKYFAVPIQALSLDAERQVFILHQSKEMLEVAPGFDKDHWPETNSHSKPERTVSYGGFMGANIGSEY
jgi:sporulation protein YlmC with PRC-barrel domain